MTARTKGILAVATILAGACLTLAFTHHGGGRKQPVDLSIWFTCDIGGRLEPCGCYSGQYGGLSRISTVLGRSSRPEDIVLDVGDAIAGPRDYNLVQFMYVLTALRRLGCEALNIGHREAGLSRDALKTLCGNSPVPIISANLVDRETLQTIFPPYRILRRHGYRIAIMGVLDPVGLQDGLGKGLHVNRMAVAIAGILPTLKPKADILILLAFTNEENLRRLAKEFYEFDLILGGKVPSPSSQLVTENRSLILFTTNKSRALGLLKATIAGPNRMSARDFDIQLMTDNIPEDPAIISLSAAYRKAIRNTKLQVDALDDKDENRVPGVREGATYIGSLTCRKCHAKVYTRWRVSKHAHAFDVLVAKGSDADPGCIGCHTIGFRTASGYRRAFGKSKLTNVGCESCHGPGSEHVSQRSDNQNTLFRFRPVGPGDCLRCHQGEYSRPFRWHLFWPAIRH